MFRIIQVLTMVYVKSSDEVCFVVSLFFFFFQKYALKKRRIISVRAFDPGPVNNASRKVSPSLLSPHVSFLNCHWYCLVILPACRDLTPYLVLLFPRQVCWSNLVLIIPVSCIDPQLSSLKYSNNR